MKRLLLILAVLTGAALGAVLPALAARSAGGTYTLPNNGTSIRNPVSAGQVITKDLWNGTFGDVGTELTDSLSRSGKGPMLTPLRLFNSTGATLDLTWDSFQTTGFYVDTGPVLGAAVGGAAFMTSTSTVTTLPLAVTVVGALTARTSFILEDPGAGTNAVTLAAPAALVESYALTAPAALPAGVAWGSGTFAVGDMRTADSGKLYVVDTAGTSTVAPSGTSADQSPGGLSRWDYYAPDYTQPLVLSPLGALGAQPLTNSMQAFGTPVQARDVATKGYVDASTATAAKTWTTLTVSGSNCTAGAGASVPQFTTFGGVVFLKGSIIHTSPTASSACALSALPVGSRPSADRLFGLVYTGTLGTAAAYTATLTASTGVIAVSAAEGNTVTWQLNTIIFPAEQ